MNGHRSGIWSVAFSPDGKLLASSSQDGTVVLWENATRRPIRTLDGKTGAVRCVAFSRDSRTLAAAVPWHGNHVKLWDVATGKERATLEGTGYSAAYSANGKWLATGGPTGQVKLWTWNGTEAIPGRSWTTTHFPIAVAFSPDGKTLHASGVTATAWDVESGKLVRTYERQGSDVYSVAVSPDGATIVHGGQDRNIRTWDASGKPASLHAHLGAVHALGFSPDGLDLATGGEDGTIRLWDMLSVDEPMVIPSVGGFTAVSPNGRVLVSGETGHRLILRETVGGREIATLEGHRGTVKCVEFSSHGKTLASADMTGVVKLWDVDSRQELGTLTEEPGSVWAMAFSPDSRILAVGWRAPSTKGHQISLWNVAARTRRSVLKGEYFWVTSLAFSRDGRRLISGHQFGWIKLWDTASGQFVKDLQGYTGGFHKVWSLAVSADGGTLAASTSNGQIALWKLAGGTPLKSLTGGTGEVSSVRFLQDGRSLVSASQDGTLRIWDVSSGQEKATLDKVPGDLTGVAVSNDGTLLVSSGPRALKVWRSDLPAPSVNGPALRAARLLQRARRNRAGHDVNKVLADLDRAIELTPENAAL